MHTNIRTKIGSLFAVIILFIAIWLLLPGRNGYGNPIFEQLIDECTIPGTESFVRMYRGNGGAMVGFCYSVTWQESRLSREKQFFYTNSYPTIRSISCQMNSVEIMLDSPDNIKTITISKIRSELVKKPIGLVYNKEKQAEIQPLQLCTTGLAFVLIGVSVLLLSVCFKASPK
ncbi:MAG: hypothetical protein JXA42_11070 [Anaerolineales bacterium]|nr:hypothetical protein [Anaerolineales bacterium]